MEGGKLPDGGYFTKPDGMIPVNLGGRDYLIVCRRCSFEHLAGRKDRIVGTGKIIWKRM